jgi:hypothetical protein
MADEFSLSLADSFNHKLDGYAGNAHFKNTYLFSMLGIWVAVNATTSYFLLSRK